MHHLRHAAVAMICILVVGCAQFAGRHPLLGYSDKKQPISDTALVVCAEQPEYLCGITGVNRTSTWETLNGGKTPWVRVLPGTQLIRLTLSDLRIVSRPSITMDNVEAGHVYRLHIVRNAEGLTATYEDLGKRDSYTIHMSRRPFSPKAYTAHF